MFRLVWTIICHLRIEKENNIHFGNVLTKLWACIYQLRTKWGEIKTPKTFCWTQNKYFHAEVWKVSLKNTEDKSLAYSLNLCPLNELGQVTTIEATKMNQKPSKKDSSSQEFCNCQHCRKMQTRLECACCHEIPEVEALHLKGKARLSWNTVVLEFTEAVVRRCFSK